MKLRHHCIEVWPYIFRQKIVLIALSITGVDGFQDLQTIALGCGNEFRLMSSFALVLSVMLALTEIVDNERIVFQQNTEIVWQVPTTFRERIQVVVYVS